MKVYKIIDKTWINKIRSGAVFLHPSDTVWGITCAAFSKKGYDKLQTLKQENSPNHVTLLVDSIPQLKRYVYQLHPRIETLLSFHNRPITLLFKEIKMLPTHILTKDGFAAISLVHDHRIKKMIQATKQPLIYMPIKTQPHSYAVSLESIPLHLRENVDFIYHPKGPLFCQPDVGKPSVVAKVNEGGGLIFASGT